MKPTVFSDELYVGPVILSLGLSCRCDVRSPASGVAQQLVAAYLTCIPWYPGLLLPACDEETSIGFDCETMPLIAFVLGSRASPAAGGNLIYRLRTSLEMFGRQVVLVVARRSGDHLLETVFQVSVHDMAICFESDGTIWLWATEPKTSMV